MVTYRFDVVGIYVVMFLEILHTLLRVLMIFSILIVAFGLAFYILLSDVSSLFALHIMKLFLSTLFPGGVPAKFFIFSCAFTTTISLAAVTQPTSYQYFRIHSLTQVSQ